PEPEVRIFDFLTHEHLELMDEVGGIVMLHIPRALRLRDPINLAQMMEIEERYPRAKVIIAHIGRAYAPEDIGNAFDVLKNTKNMKFDFTANVLTEAMVKCIEAVGTKRLMFGSDMPITKMRMYRIVENGKYINVVPRGAYGDVSNDSHMRETDETDVTTFMYEEMRAIKRAASELALSKDDIENIMYKNASELFGYTL
ncbi:MAG: amidohydrolase family protein, partial [Clostridia bacterium]|nr:amidohydrolase family protein [Clostridia bacterium]